MDIINVGIIGCGSIAKQRHAHEYNNNSNVNIIGFFDPAIERAEALAQEFGGKVYKTADEMIRDPQINALSVCAANKFHASLTIDALNNGKHVLVEKPMAVTLKDCEEMLAAANKNNKRLMVGHNQRLAPAHVKAKQILDSGELGRVISFQSTFGHKGPEMWSMDKSADTWFFKKDIAAFGSMADLGIHKIDLIRYLVDDDVASVYSTMVTVDKKFPNGEAIEVDDNSVEIINFKGGTIGTVTTSWTHYGEECNSTTLYCKNGILKLYHNPDFSVEIVYSDGTRAFYDIDHIQSNEDSQQESSGVIDTFVNAVLQNKPCPIDAEDIVKSMRIVFACMESNEKKSEVRL